MNSIKDDPHSHAPNFAQSRKVIAVDWGTSHLRAYLCELNANGHLRAIDFKAGKGVTKVSTNFKDEIFACISPWLNDHESMPVIMSGQIGSSIGWQKAPYIHAPCSPLSVAKQCIHFAELVPNSNLQQQFYIVPGVTCVHDNTIRDVMRGEELQVLGWLAQNKSHQVGTHLLCLPGTHTKWVLVDDGEIQVFKTALTGELFDLLSNQSVLIQKQSSDFDFSVFADAAEFTLNSAAGTFIHGLFSVRSKQLFNELSPEQSMAYLSGILIGSDIRAALNAKEWKLDPDVTVSIIGSEHLSQCFANVLSLANINSLLFNEKETTLLGFESIYKELVQKKAV